MCGQNSCRSYGLLRLKDEGHHLRLVDEIDGRVNRNSGCKDLIWVHFSNQDPLLLLLFLVVGAAVVVVVLNSIQSFWPIYWNSVLSSFLRVRCKTLCFEQCTEPRGTQPNASEISKCDLGKPVAILELSFLTTSLDLSHAYPESFQSIDGNLHPALPRHILAFWVPWRGTMNTRRDNMINMITNDNCGINPSSLQIFFTSQPRRKNFGHMSPAF